MNLLVWVHLCIWSVTKSYICYPPPPPPPPPPSAAYMRPWIGLAMVEIMACRLFGTKPLSNPMLDYCQLDKLQWILIKIQKFSFTKLHLKISSMKWRPCCPGADELSMWDRKIASQLKPPDATTIKTGTFPAILFSRPLRRNVLRLAAVAISLISLDNLRLDEIKSKCPFPLCFINLCKKRVQMRW